VDLFLNLDWAVLIPLIIALTAALKDFGALKTWKPELVNLLVGLLLIGVFFLLETLGWTLLALAPLEAIAVLVLNPVVYDKIAKPILDFLKGKK
jgi:hypothetical protein